MTDSTSTPASGRRRQAAANDQRILDAAREVFVADPTAPISAVAERAGVGISALYRRYASKESLLGTLCDTGQAIYIAEAERALADDGDPMDAYVGFLRRIVAADTHALSSRLAGRFTPTEEQWQSAQRLTEVGQQLFERTAAAGALRDDVTFLDVSYLLELLAALAIGPPERTAEMRQRLLTVVIDGIRSGAPTPLPGTPPTTGEQESRWIPTGDDR